MPPTVALVTEDYLPRIGGISGHVHELAKAYVHAGVGVTVVTTVGQNWPATNWKQWHSYNDRIDLVPVLRMPSVGPNTRMFRNPQMKRRLPAELAMLVESGRADVVHWHTLGSACAALAGFRAAPKIFTNHSSQFLQNLARQKRERLHRKISHADGFIAPSHELVGATIAVGINGDLVHYIPNGVDADAFTLGDRAAARQRWKIGRDGVVVLCARRIVRKNGIHVLVDAIERLVADGQEATFVFAGDHATSSLSSYEKGIYRRLASHEATGRVVLLGPRTRDQMRSVYQAANISVLPSLQEATSLTALESMASGNAVCATNIGGLPEVIRDETDGLLVPSEDPAALAAALARLIQDDDLRRRLGKTARARVLEELTWSRIAERTVAVYETVLSNWSGGRAA